VRTVRNQDPANGEARELQRRIDEQRMLQALTGNPPSTGRSKKK